MRKLKEIFIAAAGKAAAEVLEVPSWTAAVEAAVRLAAEVAAPVAGGRPVLAACDLAPDLWPGLDPDPGKAVAELCAGSNIELVTSRLREREQGVDLGLSRALFGLAETGTLILADPDEDVRLSTMTAEIHAAVLPVSALRADALALAPGLENLLAEGRPVTFVTGPSRTADIERVLTLGAHGPARLAVILVDDA